MLASTYAALIEASEVISDDRVEVMEVGNALIMAVADGAGGMKGSVQAAEAVVLGVAALVERKVMLDDEAVWSTLLMELDLAISTKGNWGRTTAIVLAATDCWVCGASVGDSEAWLATTDNFRHLTAAQERKPFLGSGRARPVSFRRNHDGGALVVSTDGLFKCAPAWQICEIAVNQCPSDACRILIDLVRLPNGQLRDDVGVVAGPTHLILCKSPENSLHIALIERSVELFPVDTSLAGILSQQ